MLYLVYVSKIGTQSNSSSESGWLGLCKVQYIEENIQVVIICHILRLHMIITWLTAWPPNQFSWIWCTLSPEKTCFSFPYYPCTLKKKKKKSLKWLPWSYILRDWCWGLYSSPPRLFSGWQEHHDMLENFLERQEKGWYKAFMWKTSLWFEACTKMCVDSTLLGVFPDSLDIELIHSLHINKQNIKINRS